MVLKTGRVLRGKISMSQRRNMKTVNALGKKTYWEENIAYQKNALT